MAWSDNETRTYSYDGTDTAINETLDSGFTYNVVVHGADGGDDDFSGGQGGFIEAEYKIDPGNPSEGVEIYVGEYGGKESYGNKGGWGRFDGGSANSFQGRGGGSTEVILSAPSAYTDSKLVVADAGGGGTEDGFGDEYGGGGARCGNAQGGGATDGECPPDGIGFGGEGGRSDAGSPGGQEAANGATLLNETTGGSQHPDGTDNGYVEITASQDTVPVSGRVLENGVAVDNATVEIIPHTGSSGTVTTTDSNGDWSANIAPGTHHFVARYTDGVGDRRTFSKPFINVN